MSEHIFTSCPVCGGPIEPGTFEATQSDYDKRVEAERDGLRNDNAILAGELDIERQRAGQVEAERDTLQERVAQLEAQARGYRATLRSAGTWLEFNAKGSALLLRTQINDSLEGKYLEVPTKEAQAALAGSGQGGTEE